MQRFQYSEALIRRMLWDQICSQILLALIFVFLTIGLDSLGTGSKWVRGAFVGVFAAGGVLSVMCWWDWRRQRETFSWICLPVVLGVYCLNLLIFWLLGSSVFNAAGTTSILLGPVASSIFGPRTATERQDG